MFNFNSGSGNESCVWVNPKDVESPIITTWADVLTSGYKYNPYESKWEITDPDSELKYNYFERTWSYE